ncbi:hypothetical protein L9F63_006708, partial [Diploptera punctata]
IIDMFRRKSAWVVRVCVKVITNRNVIFFITKYLYLPSNRFPLNDLCFSCIDK